MREWTFFDRAWMQVSLAVCVGAVLGLIGPFGSYGRLPVELRLVHWVILVGLNWGLMVSAGRVAAHFRPSWPPVRLAVMAALVAALPGASASMALVEHWGWGGAATPWLQGYLYVALIDLSVGLPMTLLLAPRAPLSEEAPVPTPEPVSPAAFLRRLPPRLGADLLAVEAEDHYLRVHTSLGSNLILMRMADAEAELEGIAGARVHRSWWVARGAVTDAERQGQGARLTLRNGLTVPVSRGRVAVLKAEGWL